VWRDPKTLKTGEARACRSRKIGAATAETLPFIRKRKNISISGKIQAQNAFKMLIGSRNVPAPTRESTPYVVIGPFWPSVGPFSRNVTT